LVVALMNVATNTTALWHLSKPYLDLIRLPTIAALIGSVVLALISLWIIGHER